MHILYEVVVILCCVLCVDCFTRCMSCTNQPLPRVCETVETCGANQVCFVEKVTNAGHVLYNSGCRNQTLCPNAAIVGKRGLVKRAANPLECCHTDFCNKEGFGFTDVPKSQRGPHCFSGSYAIDVSQTTHLITCRQTEVCAISRDSFTGSSDIFYSQKCLERSSCPSIHPYAGCDGSCCDQDYCNDRCAHYTTPPPTVSYNDLLQTECLKHINAGYFYDSYSNFCVLLVKSHGLFNQAQAAQACRATKGELVSVNNQDEQDFLLSWIFSHKANDTDFWIGAKANVSKSYNYRWPDGGSASDLGVYNHWSGVMMGQPDDRRTKNENCVFLNNKDRYFWHDDECSALKTGYVCEIWNVTGDKVRTCRQHVFDGFFYDSTSDMCLLFHETRLPQFTQTAAAAECNKYGASLVTIDNDVKMDFMLKWIFSNHQNATDFWIGAQDIHDTSEFYWPNGQKLSYTHWGNPVIPPEPHGQPDAAYGVTDQRCVFMDFHQNYLWFDEVCSSAKSGFICQYNGTDRHATKLECSNRLTRGYFYDAYTNMCVSLKSRQNVNYQQAHDACAAEHSTLAVIDSQDKTDFIMEWIFYHKINDTDFWIGGKDPLGNNNFIWEQTGQKLVYTNWYTIAPIRPQDCAILDHIDVYRWKTADCESKVHGYVCQINQKTMSSA